MKKPSTSVKVALKHMCSKAVQASITLTASPGGTRDSEAILHSSWPLQFPMKEVQKGKSSWPTCHRKVMAPATRTVSKTPLCCSIRTTSKDHDIYIGLCLSWRFCFTPSDRAFFCCCCFLGGETTQNKNHLGTPSLPLVPAASPPAPPRALFVCPAPPERRGPLVTEAKLGQKQCAPAGAGFRTHACSGRSRRQRTCEGLRRLAWPFGFLAVLSGAQTC